MADTVAPMITDAVDEPSEPVPETEAEPVQTTVQQLVCVRGPAGEVALAWDAERSCASFEFVFRDHHLALPAKLARAVTLPVTLHMEIELPSPASAHELAAWIRASLGPSAEVPAPATTSSTITLVRIAGELSEGGRAQLALGWDPGEERAFFTVDARGLPVDLPPSVEWSPGGATVTARAKLPLATREPVCALASWIEHTIPATPAVTEAAETDAAETDAAEADAPSED